MTVVNPKSISGINSITTGSGSDDILTIHNNNGTERLRVDSTGATKIVTGIVTTLTATTGIVTTLTTNTLTANSTAKVGSGVTLSPDGDLFVTGVCTATSFVGSGANLTGITGTTINNNGSNRIITGSGTANTLEGESTFIYDGTSIATIDTSQTYATFRLDGNAGGVIEFYENGTRKWEMYGTDSALQIYDRDNTSYHTKFLDGGDLEVFNGNVKFASGHGIDFSAAGNAGGMTSELLDDYEEGTYTPVLNYASSDSGNKAYADRYGVYTKIGRKVTVLINFALSNTGSGSGVLELSLPFAVPDLLSGTSLEASGFCAYYSQLSSSVSSINMTALQGTSKARFDTSKGTQNTATVPLTFNEIGHSFSIRASITYFVA